MKKIWGGILAAVVVVAVGIFVFISKQQKSSKLVQIKKGTIVEAIYGLGTVVPRQKFSFKVGVPKTVTRLYVNEGDEVKQGQALLSFDDGIQVRSPFLGTVTSLPYKAGENAFTDQAVVTVQNLKDLYLEAKLDQLGALRVKKNMKARISFENLRQKTFVGQIDSLYPANGQFVARIVVENLSPEILPGMTADVAIEVAEKENVLLIPVRAIHSGQVVVLRGAKPEKIAVAVGVMDNEWAELTSDNLSEGDQIVLKD